MKIQQLIKIFEQLLPIYKKAYEEDWDKRKLDIEEIDCGICWSADVLLKNTDVYDVFETYYKNIIIDGGYLYNLPSSGKDLKSRIDFMESEIIDLNKLLKKGYTHV
jgi:hypothetical protein